MFFVRSRSIVRLGPLVLALVWLRPAAAGPRPLDLEAATARFQTESPKALALRARVELARAGQAGARVRPNPTLAVEVEALPDKAGVVGSRQDTVKLSHPILAPGKLGARLATAQAELTSSQASVDKELFALVIGLRRQFFRALAASQVLEAQQASAKRLESLRSRLAKREQEGFASKYDVMRLAAEAGQLDLQLKAAAIELARQTTLLAGVLGLSQAEPLELQGPLEPPEVDRPPDDSLARHPDQVELERGKDVARAQLEQAHREARPDFAVFGGSLDYDQSVTQRGFTVGLAIDLPIHDRGQREKAEARARLGVAEREQSALATGLLARLHAAWNAYEAERARLGAARVELLERPEQILSTLSASYAEGEHGLLELLDAYRLERESRLGYIRQAETARAAFIDLEEASGRLLTPGH
ncbi:MAG: TolC family protein [Candidatus Wallbacteria bacterium]|nr:TolC family protein [Candidatus Wallbacteria bacterium]